MNRVSLFVIGLLLTFGLTALAQQTTTRGTDNSVPEVEGHLATRSYFAQQAQPHGLFSLVLLLHYCLSPLDL